MDISKTQKTFLASVVFILSLSFCALNLGWQVLFLFIVFLFVIIKKNIFSAVFSTVLIIIWIFGCVYFEFRAHKFDELSLKAPLENATLTGRIVSLPDFSPNLGKASFFMKVYSINTQNIKKAKTVVTIYDKQRRFESLQIGDVITIKGKLNKPFAPQNPSQFNYKEYLKNKNIFTTFSSKEDQFEIINNSNFFWSFIREINLIRDNIIKKHSQFLKSPRIELMGSVVFGDRAVGVPDYVQDNFIHSGLLHLLAASGLNVALIFGIWFFILSKFRVNYRFNVLSGMFIILFYMLMTGLPPSITRAGIMLELALIAKLIDRKSEAMTLLGMVGAIMLLYNPLYIKDISFQLSFIVTYGIIACGSLINKKFEPLPVGISSAIMLPLIAQMWVLGFQVFYFNNIAIYSVFANILVLPFIAVISFCGFMGSIISIFPFSKPIYFLFDKFVDPFLRAVLAISEFVKGLPYSLAYVSQPSVSDVFLYYIIISIAFLLLQHNFKEKTKLVLKSLLVVLTIGLIFSYAKFDFEKNLEVTFFSVGNSDAILVKFPDNKYMTIDSGDKGYGGYSSGKAIVNEYFKDNGIKTLSAMVFTHYDRDHIGGGKDILKFVNAKNVIMPKKSCITPTCLQLFKEIKPSKTKPYIIDKSKKLIIDKKVKIRIITPRSQDDNDSSLVTYMRYKKFSILLMGDNTEQSFCEVKKYVKSPVTVFKIGHHGGARTLNDEMLETLQPKLIIISTGKNRYNHPTPKTIETIKKHNIPYLRTDFDNAIKISTDGKKTRIYTYDSEKKRWIKYYPPQ